MILTLGRGEETKPRGKTWKQESISHPVWALNFPSKRTQVFVRVAKKKKKNQKRSTQFESELRGFFRVLTIQTVIVDIPDAAWQASPLGLTSLL